MIDFKVNQEFIAKVFCVNKAVPKSSCNGKCYLKKQLKQAEEREQQPSTKALTENTISHFYLPKSDMLLALGQVVKAELGLPFYPSFTKFLFICRLFRPPK